MSGGGLLFFLPPLPGHSGTQLPFHDKTVVVTNCGRLCLYRKKIKLSTCLAGQAVGIKEVDNGIWLVSFMQYDLGYIDLEEKICSPSTTPSGQKCYLCLRNVLLPMSPGRTKAFWRARRDSNPRPIGSKPMRYEKSGTCSVVHFYS